MVRSQGAPADRVRALVRSRAGETAARAVSDSYQRLGRVLLLRLPEEVRPQFPAIGRAWQEVLGVATVLRHRGPAEGERRTPRVERIAGTGTTTEVVEHGVRFRFDAARTMFSRGNGGERARAGAATRPGETVVDLFAGIGYFVLPALVVGGAAGAYAVEENPESYRSLVENLRLNGVEDRAVALLGDNRELPLPVRGADRVFLGYLPSAVPWIPTALDLVRPGATLHVHLVVDSRNDRAGAEATVVEAVGRTGSVVHGSTARRVKPYGPGRSHVVVDVVVTPRAA
jgi:tRNA wybutosine-synthesizing protein 2